MFRVVIPARYASSRFPGKPLVEIAGRPLLAWVHACARRTAAAEVLIATDDVRIAAVGEQFGAEVVMTDPGHASGTDRIAEVAVARGWGAEDIVVNLQGDEPLMPHALVDQVAGCLARHPGAAIATAAMPLRSAGEFLDRNVVKVVCDPHGRALYFSRAPIPCDRDAAQADPAAVTAFAAARRHIGLYAYRVAALRALAACAPTPLEQLERLEQLRALEHRFAIQVVEACERPGADVNTPADVAAAALGLGEQVRER